MASELVDRLSTIATELGEVDVKDDGGRVTYARASRPFAVVQGSTVEFGLDPDVAGAVLRTPHTEASARGAGWVRFAPPAVDGSVFDRAESWFRSAWRVAEP